MRNVSLENIILKLLHEQQEPMSFLQLMYRVDIDVAQPYLTREEFLDTIRRLEDLELIVERKNLLGYERFFLTEKGEQAFDETFFSRRGSDGVCHVAEGKRQLRKRHRR